MFSFTIFILSGVAIVVIVSAKWWELRKHESVWVLRMISKGDESFKILSHNATHLYSVYREKLEFLIKKQVPLHSKNIVNKTSSLVKQKLVEIKGDIRNTKILGSKNSEGISEFFKNMKNLEEEKAEAIKDMEKEKKSKLEEKKKKG